MDDKVACEIGEENLTGSTQSLNSTSAKPEGVEIECCCDCKRTFKSCSCKSCAKCGALFLRYWGTPFVKGRSHCRICCAAVCITCHVIVYDTFKICTRCHIKQKEDELSTQMALSAITSAKNCSQHENLSFASTKDSSQEKKNEILISASKKGDHHVVSTILSAGAEINTRDADGNTALLFASRGAYLPCMALLIEKGADVSAANKFGWTPLHALACNGRGENVVECADLLIQMGAVIFAMTDRGETAGDLAEQSGEQEQLLAILRAAEVEEAIQCLCSKLSISEFCKEKETWKYVKTLLKVVTDVQKSESDNYADDMSLVPNSYMPEEMLSKTKIDSKKTMSLNRVFSRAKTSNQVCKACGQCPTYSDVEPVVRRDLMESPEAIQLKEQLAKCQQENDELEKRCKKLMNSISLAVDAREKKEVEICRLKTELDKSREEKELAIQRCEATYTNKVTKVQKEADFAVHKARERLEEVEKDQEDLVHLQSVHKLTWIPDKIVSRCMNTKCRAPFNQTRRRHHCRCCGRVFCSNCSSHNLPLEQLGYSDPVRMCNQCFALLDETFVEVEYSEIGDME